MPLVLLLLFFLRGLLLPCLSWLAGTLVVRQPLLWWQGVPAGCLNLHFHVLPALQIGEVAPLRLSVLLLLGLRLLAVLVVGLGFVVAACLPLVLARGQVTAKGLHCFCRAVPVLGQEILT